MESENTKKNLKESIREYFIPVNDDREEDKALLDNLDCLSPIDKQSEVANSEIFSKLSEIESKNFQVDDIISNLDPIQGDNLDRSLNSLNLNGKSPVKNSNQAHLYRKLKDIGQIGNLKNLQPQRNPKKVKTDATVSSNNINPISLKEFERRDSDDDTQNFTARLRCNPPEIVFTTKPKIFRPVNLNDESIEERLRRELESSQLAEIVPDPTMLSNEYYLSKVKLMGLLYDQSNKFRTFSNLKTFSNCFKLQKKMKNTKNSQPLTSPSKDFSKNQLSNNYKILLEKEVSKLQTLHEKDIKFREKVLADKEERLKMSYTKLINGLRNDIKKNKEQYKKGMEKTITKYEQKIEKLSNSYNNRYEKHQRKKKELMESLEAKIKERDDELTLQDKKISELQNELNKLAKSEQGLVDELEELKQDFKDKSVHTAFRNLVKSRQKSTFDKMKGCMLFEYRRSTLHKLAHSFQKKKQSHLEDSFKKLAELREKKHSTARALALKMNKNAHFDIKVVIERLRALLLLKEGKKQSNFVHKFKNLGVSIYLKERHSLKNWYLADLRELAEHIKKTMAVKKLVCSCVARSHHGNKLRYFQRLFDHKEAENLSETKTFALKINSIFQKLQTDRLTKSISSIQKYSATIANYRKDRTTNLVYTLSKFLTKKSSISKTTAFLKLKTISSIDDTLHDITMDFSQLSPFGGKEQDETCLDILTQLQKPSKIGIDIGTQVEDLKNFREMECQTLSSIKRQKSVEVEVYPEMVSKQSSNVVRCYDACYQTFQNTRAIGIQNVAIQREFSTEVRHSSHQISLWSQTTQTRIVKTRDSHTSAKPESHDKFTISKPRMNTQGTNTIFKKDKSLNSSLVSKKSKYTKSHSLIFEAGKSFNSKYSPSPGKNKNARENSSLIEEEEHGQLLESQIISESEIIPRSNTQNSMERLQLFGSPIGLKSSFFESKNMKNKGNDPIQVINPIKQIQCNFKTFTDTKRHLTDLTAYHITKLERNQKAKLKKKSQYVQTFKEVQTHQEVQVDTLKKLLSENAKTPEISQSEENPVKDIKTSDLNTMQSSINLNLTNSKPQMVDKSTQKKLIELNNLEEDKEDIQDINDDYDQLFENKLADLIDINLGNDDEPEEDSRDLSAPGGFLDLQDKQKCPEPEFKFSEFLNDSAQNPFSSSKMSKIFNNSIPDKLSHNTNSEKQFELQGVSEQEKIKAIKLIIFQKLIRNCFSFSQKCDKFQAFSRLKQIKLLKLEQIRQDIQLQSLARISQNHIQKKLSIALYHLRAHYKDSKTQNQAKFKKKVHSRVQMLKKLKIFSSQLESLIGPGEFFNILKSQ